MFIVDSQVHIWAADRADRPWPAGRAGQAQKPYPVGKEALLLQKVLQDVSGIIERIGKEKGYYLVVEKRGAGVIYAAPEADLTDEIIRAFDKQSGTKPAAGSPAPGGPAPAAAPAPAPAPAPSKKP